MINTKIKNVLELILIAGIFYALFPSGFIKVLPWLPLGLVLYYNNKTSSSERKPN